MERLVRTACLVSLLAVALPFAASPSAATVLEVPVVRQQKDGCGAASLAMVLDYWRAARPELALPRADPDALYRTLYSPEHQGIPAAALIRHLDQIGFNALPLKATRADIEDQLARGRPLIAALKDGNRLHYVVVRGIEPDAVWINDPWDGKPHRLPWRSFDQRWKGGANWLLLAVPQSSSSR
jgi:ABC-type bacteriocin/lantibiotic exporter with double-glycine peptidase domain